MNRISSSNVIQFLKLKFLPLMILMLILQWLLSPVNLVGQDFINRTLAQYRTADQEIVLVTIDDESLIQLQDEWGRWPWDRSLHAFLLEQMLDAGAKAVGYDVLFSQPDSIRSDGDSYFNEVLASSNKAIIAMAILASGQDKPAMKIRDLLQKEGRYIGFIASNGADPAATISLDLPWAISPESWRLGAVNFFSSQDGAGRKYPLFIDISGWLVPSLAEKTRQAGQSSPSGHPRTNPNELDVPKSSQITINWQSTEMLPYRTFNYWQLYQWFEQGDLASFEAAFKDKYVIVGATASGLFEARPTAISSFQPGLAIHATALDNLKNEAGYQTSNALNWFAATLLLVVLVIGTRFSFIGQVWIGVIGWLASIGFLLSVSLYVAWSGYILLSWLELSIALGLVIVVNLINESWQVYLENIRTLDTFSRFMEPKIVKLLSRQKKLAPAALTQRCELSVLFTDIRGFTTLSESRSAEQVIELLNQYFSGQVAQIFHHQGTFDKYIGDAIMAFWGAPVEDPHHADHAVACGLAMLDELEQFKKTLGPEVDDFNIGIGIHSGPAVVGMLGSSQRYDYTAIGDTVNVASRIEGQTKNRARLLISSETRQQLTVSYDFKSHGLFQLKGRIAETELFEVIRKRESFTHE